MKTYTAVATGICMGDTAAMFVYAFTESDVICILFVWVMMAALGASGYLALVEWLEKKRECRRTSLPVVLKKRRIRNLIHKIHAGCVSRKRRHWASTRKFQTFILEGEFIEVPVIGAPDLVELRNVVAKK